MCSIFPHEILCWFYDISYGQLTSVLPYMGISDQEPLCAFMVHCYNAAIAAATEKVLK